MRPGDRRIVASVEGSTANELAWEGVLPGIEVAVVSRAPLGGPFVVDLGGVRLAISTDVAAQVRIVPCEPAPERA